FGFFDADEALDFEQLVDRPGGQAEEQMGHNFEPVVDGIEPGEKAGKGEMVDGIYGEAKQEADDNADRQLPFMDDRRQNKGIDHRDDEVEEYSHDDGDGADVVEQDIRPQDESSCVVGI